MNTFKAVVEQSTDIVFIVDNKAPYKVVYGNKIFYEQIGDKLADKSLAGMQVDEGAFSFHEEFIINLDNEYFSFFMEELKEDHVFLFHRGTKVKITSTAQGAETRQFSNGEMQFFKLLNEKVPSANFQLVLDGDGKMCFSYLSDRVKKMFKLEADGEEITSLDYLLSKVHPMDVGKVLKSIVHRDRKSVV